MRKILIIIAIASAGCGNPYKWENKTVCIQGREYLIEWDVARIWRAKDTGNNCIECEYERNLKPS